MENGIFVLLVDEDNLQVARSQNVPKTKVEGVKSVEITKGRKKFVRAKNTG